MKVPTALLLAFVVPFAQAALSADVCYTYAIGSNQFLWYLYTDIGAIPVNEKWNVVTDKTNQEKKYWQVNRKEQEAFNVLEYLKANRPQESDPEISVKGGTINDQCFESKEVAERDRKENIRHYLLGDDKHRITEIHGDWSAQFNSGVAQNEKPLRTQSTTANGAILTREVDPNTTSGARAARQKDNATFQAEQDAKRKVAKSGADTNNKVREAVVESAKREYCLADAARKLDCGCMRFYPDMKGATVCAR